MAKVCLIRHGQTDWNKKAKLQGRTNIVLNRTGEYQAKKVAEYLKDFSWNKIVSCPLKRAKRTATIIAEAVGIQEITIDEGLIERHFGLAEGMTAKERLAKYPDRRYDGMEDWNTLRDRVISTVNRHIRANKDNNIIFVSHQEVINSVLHTVSDGEYGSGITKLYLGSVNMLEYVNNNLEVEFYNLKPY